jgi:hypothetical protein
MPTIVERRGKVYLAGFMSRGYAEKVAALRRHFERLGVDLDALIKARFPSRFAGTTVRKSDVVRGLLDDELRLQDWSALRLKLREFSYMTDRRHTEEYALDLVMGWVSEEWIRDEIDRQAGKPGTVELVGADYEREFLPRARVHAVADFKIAKPGKSVLVDLMVDYKGTWIKNRAIDLKKGKVGYMRNGKLDAVLGFDIQGSTFYVIKLPQLTAGRSIVNAAMGSNTTLRVPLPRARPVDVLYDAL